MTFEEIYEYYKSLPRRGRREKITEPKQIFENSHFKTINGISKEQLKSIYNSGEVGKKAVYSILQEK